MAVMDKRHQRNNFSQQITGRLLSNSGATGMASHFFPPDYTVYDPRVALDDLVSSCFGKNTKGKLHFQMYFFGILYICICIIIAFFTFEVIVFCYFCTFANATKP